MDITLPPEIAAQIEFLVSTGNYKDETDVIVHAVALLYEEVFGEPSQLVRQIDPPAATVED